ncbi:hypothetical protein VNO77_33875 [Canavalia gladiata]|uniref:Uncharacterized protein n=1 Tax=Canavalia gladiata TaxID=3824 RepID=A0AAN9PWS0_CANGL
MAQIEVEDFRPNSQVQDGLTLGPFINNARPVGLGIRKMKMDCTRWRSNTGTSIDLEQFVAPLSFAFIRISGYRLTPSVWKFLRRFN